MQEDRITWNTLKLYCKYKLRSKTQVFCKNEYNVTGVCGEKSCPLANSKYATVREENGICYLYMKTIERSHFPNKLWEKIKLSRKTDKAKDQIRQELIYWPSFNIAKCLNRLLKTHEYLNRTRKLRLSSRIQRELIPIRRKIDRREKRKEFKALKAADIENKIEKELVERLKNGMYNELYSFPLSAFDKAVNDPKRELMDLDEDEGEDSDDEEIVREYVIDSDIGESDYEISDIEDLERELSQLGDWRADLRKREKSKMTDKVLVSDKNIDLQGAAKSEDLTTQIDSDDTEMSPRQFKLRQNIRKKVKVIKIPIARRVKELTKLPQKAVLTQSRF